MATTPTIETYMYGAAAHNFLRSEDSRHLAAYLMKDKYFNVENPVLAQAMIDFEEAILSGGNVLGTSAGKRVATERALYDNFLGGLTLKDIAGSCLGTGIAAASKSELITKDGTAKFGDVRKSLMQYQNEAEALQRRFKTEENELQTEYQRAMLGAYTDDDREAVSDKYEPKLRGLAQRSHNKSKDLETKYSAKDLHRRFEVVRSMESALFANIGRDATLKNAYFPIKLENLRRVSQN